MKKFLLILMAAVATSVAAWAQDTYVVAGVAELCGSTWDGNDANNQMTLQGDGTYVKTFTNVAVMKGYQFKIVKNGSEWIGDKTGQNVTFNVSTACDVNIYYNPANNDITVQGAGVGDPTFEINKVVAVGNGSGNWLNGASWNPNADENQMAEVGDKVYKITYNEVAAGTECQVKFALNGAWTDNFGGTFGVSGEETEANYNGANITFSTAAVSNVTLKLDLSNFDYNSKSGAKFTITVAQAGPVELNYYMKHPWGGGEWTWKQLEKDENGTYFVEAEYGENGVNISTVASGSNARWYEKPMVEEGIVLGDVCHFVYYPENDYVAIYKVVPTGINDVNVKSNSTYKTIKNGQVIIVKDNVKYNVMGARVK